MIVVDRIESVHQRAARLVRGAVPEEELAVGLNEIPVVERALQPFFVLAAVIGE